MFQNKIIQLAALSAVAFLTGCASTSYIEHSQTARFAASSELPVALNYSDPTVNKKEKTIKPFLRSSLAKWKGNRNTKLNSLIIAKTEHSGVDGSGSNALTMLSIPPAIFTAFATPILGSEELTTAIRVERDGMVLYDHAVREHTRSMITWMPWHVIFGFSTGDEPYRRLIESTMARHRVPLAEWMNEEKRQYEQVVARPVPAQRNWLQENPKTLYREKVLESIAAYREGTDAIAWHQTNRETFDDYARYIPEHQKVWFFGPDGSQPADVLASLQKGGDADIIAARIESNGGPYPSFSDEQITTLKDGGLPQTIILAMIRADGPNWSSGSGSADQGPTARQVEQKRPDLADLVMDHTAGEYMNPWTSDGVLADWVDTAINADMGSAAGATVGAAAGAVAANQLADNIPGAALLGGFAGSQAGEAAGREAAIDEAYIRKTSDQSFESLEDMARYLKATYSHTRHYDEAIEAANSIYPGLQAEIREL